MTLGVPFEGLVCETGSEYADKAVLFLRVALMGWGARQVGMLVGRLVLDSGPVDWKVRPAVGY